MKLFSFLSFSPAMQVLLVILLLCKALNHLSVALNQEGLILQQVKLSLSDPEGFLSGWSDRDETPCNWAGVNCDKHNSVVEVVLSGESLSGSFPESICRLSSLTTLVLSNNGFNSKLPLSISSCRNLSQLDLSQNFFVGPIPYSLSDLHFLRHLNLEGNNFSGDIPSTFGKFQRLESLNLMENLLNGTIPAVLGNITSLKKLWIGYNPYSSGQIPNELGNLTNLEELWLAQSHLVGMVPNSLGRLGKLKNLDLSGNWLTGSIPITIFQLHNIIQIELFQNNFTGSLPSGWSNLTDLRRFDASANDLTGIIPKDLCDLPLESLNLYQNQLDGLIPKNIAKSPNLYELKLFGNQLSGSLPIELGKNSGLVTLDVSYNNLTGNIPEFLCVNRVLEDLVLLNNQFSGSIPNYLGDCVSLRRVRLSSNKLYGEVPAQFWGLPHVYLLDLYENSLSGNISSLVRAAQNLSTLRIANNKLSGIIPNEIGMLSNLVEFSAKGNWLSGEIPGTVVNLAQLGKLDLSDNDLTGEFPKEIHSLKQLNELNLSNNKLYGALPSDIGNLPVLNYLDLSQNNFSGVIPLSLQNLKLNKLNLSINHFSGDIPPLFANAFYRDSFLGNPNLCFPDSHSCKSRSGRKSRSSSLVIASVLSILGIFFLVGIFWCAWKYKYTKKSYKRRDIVKWTSFHKLGFSELEIGDSLKEANVIGNGSSGKVYKVELSNGQIVAVKKLHERSYKGLGNNLKGLNYNSDEFQVEVETLGTIRHKNIVRLWCSCNSGNCKLLVYEYMPNGSLGDLLHGTKRKLLDWPMRLKIASDAAEGLSYLHHDSVPSIVHRDVKSNNILLDEDFGAKLSDFGVAKVVKSSPVNKIVEPMSAIAGSCGYIAPEYAYTLCVNEKSDIYSFGIVILELVTGKTPTNDSDFGGRDLAAWVRTTLDQKGTDPVFDPTLDSRFNGSIGRVLDIGLLCTNSLPANRPTMRRVVLMLQELVADMSSRMLEKDGKNLTVSL